MLKLLSITLPHVTEEIYQAYFRQFEKEESVHLLILAPVDVEGEFDLKAGDEVIDLLGKIRQYKTENKLSMKTRIDKAVIATNYADFVRSVDYDLKAVSSIDQMEVIEGEQNIKFGNVVEE